MLDEPVHLSPHQASWARVFEREAEQLRSLGFDKIEHIGSTAVPGLIAKPIVDLMLGVPSWPPSRELIDTLRQRYETLGEAGVPQRHYFRARDHEPRNVHVVEHNGQHWRANLALCDLLRRDPAARERYARAKEQALADGHDMLLAYSNAKADVVRALIERA